MPYNNRILVIDDDESIAASFSSILSAQSYNTELYELLGGSLIHQQLQHFEVDTAFQGAEGYEKFKFAFQANKPYAVVFIDVRMPPGWDGVKTAQMIRKVDPLAEIVIVTAFSDADIGVIIKTIGSSERLLYLKKPFDNDEIIQMTNNLSKRWNLEHKVVNLRAVIKNVAERFVELNLAFYNDWELRSLLQKILQHISEYLEANDVFLVKLDNDQIVFQLKLGRFIENKNKLPDINQVMHFISQKNQGKRVYYLDNYLYILLSSSCGQHIIVGVWLNNDTSDDEQDIDCADQLFEMLVNEMANMFDMSNRMQQLYHAQKLESLGVLCGGIAHDFNNLLMNILGNADIALMDISPDQSSHQRLKSIEASALSAADLCKQLLAYSGKGECVLSSIHMSDLITDMVAMLNVSISKSITLKQQLNPKIPLIYADEMQIRQVIMNLITNASESIIDHIGYITISTGQIHCDRTYLDNACYQLSEGEYIYFEVTDTGSGIQSEIQKKIFDPFFTTKETGRGLGMAAVQGILRAHQGGIMINSQLGKGTTMRVLLPVASVQNKSKPALQLVNEFPVGAALVVDDDHSVCNIVKHMLEKMGFNVLIANNGREALGIVGAQSEPLTLIILDMTMPQMDGIETYQEIRCIESQVPILFSSGYSEGRILQQISDDVFTGFIQKPYKLSILRDKIGQVLSR